MGLAVPASATKRAGEIAGEVARLLLLEEEAAHVRRLRLHIRLREVDDREVDVGEAVGHGLDRFGHQEADADHDVVVLLGECGEVRDVVRVRARDDDASLDAELVLGPLQPLVREEVERAVVEAADVRDEADLDRRPRAAGRVAAGIRGGRARCVPVVLVVPAAACRCEHEHRQKREQEEPEVLPSRHGPSHTRRPHSANNPERLSTRGRAGLLRRPALRNGVRTTSRPCGRS